MGRRRPRPATPDLPVDPAFYSPKRVMSRIETRVEKDGRGEGRMCEFRAVSRVRQDRKGEFVVGRVLVWSTRARLWFSSD